jgi:hypothetical protein
MAPCGLTVCEDLVNCNSIQVRWSGIGSYPCTKAYSVQVTCHQVSNIEDCTPIHISQELPPKTRAYTFENLSEKSRYRISVSYLVRHDCLKLQVCGTCKVFNLPSAANVEAVTWGADAATHLTWKIKKNDMVSLRWKLAVMYGFNKPTRQILCYKKCDEYTKVPVKSFKTVRIGLEHNERHYMLGNLENNCLYKVWIETESCCATVRSDPIFIMYIVQLDIYVCDGPTKGTQTDDIPPEEIIIIDEEIVPIPIPPDVRSRPPDVKPKIKYRSSKSNTNKWYPVRNADGVVNLYAPKIVMHAPPPREVCYSVTEIQPATTTVKQVVRECEMVPVTVCRPATTTCCQTNF